LEGENAARFHENGAAPQDGAETEIRHHVHRCIVVAHLPQRLKTQEESYEIDRVDQQVPEKALQIPVSLRRDAVQYDTVAEPRRQRDREEQEQELQLHD